MTQTGMENSSGPFKIGSVVDEKVRILELLGSGAKGFVYKGEHLTLAQLCALKVLMKDYLSDDESLRRFKLEAQLSCQLSHPHIVNVRSFAVTSDGYPYLMMDFLEGEDLSSYLARNKVLDPLNFKEIFEQMADALEYAHNNGVIHRDIKSSNIFLLKSNTNKSNEKAVLIDFGLAKSLEKGSSQSLTKTGAFAGTPAYMSPEQCKAEAASKESDLYSLGVVMYEAITGKKPFEAASDFLLMQKHLSEDATFPKHSDCPEELKKLILKLLSKERKLRGSAAELKQALAAMKVERLSAEAREGKQKKNAVPLIPKVSIAVLVLALAAYALFGFSKGANKMPRKVKLEEINPPRKTTALIRQKFIPGTTDPLDLLNQSESFRRKARPELSEAQFQEYTDNACFYAEKAEEIALKNKDYNTAIKAGLQYLHAYYQNSFDEERLNKLLEMEKTIDSKADKISTRVKIVFYNELGTAFYQSGKSAKAKPYFLKALGYTSDDETTSRLENLRSLALCFCTESKLEELEEIVSRMEKLDSYSSQTFEAELCLASMYCSQKNKEKFNSRLDFLAQTVRETKIDKLSSKADNLASLADQKGYNQQAEIAREIARIIRLNNESAGKSRDSALTGNYKFVDNTYLELKKKEADRNKSKGAAQNSR